MADQLLQRGDVVAYAGRYFVVWKAAPYDLEPFPLPSASRSRSAPSWSRSAKSCSGGLICRVVGATARAYAAQFIAPDRSGEYKNNSEVIAALTTAE
jgi:hypothetical protein